jgi:hypothetical protein
VGSLLQLYAYVPTFGNTKFEALSACADLPAVPAALHPSPDGINNITLTVPDSPV